MEKVNIIRIVIAVFLILLISCKNGSQATNKKGSATNQLERIDDNGFKSFQAKFTPKSVDELNDLGAEFNNSYLAKDYSLVEVSQIYKDNFMENINTEDLYYGFVTELPNKSLLLTFLKHSGGEINTDSEMIDTTFFVSYIFDDSGKPYNSFKSFGSNLTGEPPTYNLISKFENEKDKLVIINYEYSTGKSYSEAVTLVDDGPIYMADLTLSKYWLNYETNEIKLINIIKQKTKVAEVYSDSQPVYLQPLE